MWCVVYAYVVCVYVQVMCVHVVYMCASCVYACGGVVYAWYMCDVCVWYVCMKSNVNACGNVVMVCACAHARVCVSVCFGVGAVGGLSRLYIMYPLINKYKL